MASFKLELTLAAVALVSSSGAIGFLLGQGERPVINERTMARALFLPDAQVVGYDCGNHRNVVIAEYEDEVLVDGCREIRPLDEEI